MNAPAVSVILAVQNGERFLEGALASVSAQTRTDFELLIVDDASTDRTPDIASAWCARDPRGRILKSEGPGIANARNTALRVARADWIALFDHDDEWLPTKLARQLDWLPAHPDVVALGTWARYIGSRGRVAGLYSFGPRSAEEFRASRRNGDITFLLTPSVLLRKDVVLRCGGFSAEFSAGSDLILYDALSRHGDLVALQDPLVRYRIHAASISSTRNSLQRQVIRFLRHNLQAANAGQPPVSFADFRRLPSESGLFARLRHRWADRGNSLYRLAGGLIADGHWIRGGLSLAAASALTPAYVIRKLFLQRFRPPAPTEPGNSAPA